MNVLITGCSRGIGREVLELLLKNKKIETVFALSSNIAKLPIHELIIPIEVDFIKENWFNKVIEINVDENLLLKRIINRASEGNNIRDDDNSEILKNRIIVYKKDTLPVLKYYRDLNKLNTVDGMQNIEKVSEDILKLLT